MGDPAEIKGRGKILLVDDNPANLKLLMEMLVGRGHIVYPTTNGEMAIRFAQSSQPDLILLDIRMPVLDGYQVCEQLKATDGTRDIPVIFISGNDEVLDKVKAFSKGGVDYILKPFEPEEALARIETHLSLRNLQKALEERVEARTAELIDANARMVKEIETRKRIEEELRNAHDELEMRVVERTNELKITNERLELEIIERKQAETVLAKRSQELARSNAELEQFAYVASHDLQEPLRMITSFLQLLKQRYTAQLDATAHEFIDYAVDGAGRMQGLIIDLLAYSRITTKAKPFERIDCTASLQKALANLRMAIEETGAQITCDPLPTLNADPSQLTQLFQNLISNAIKFRHAESPQIRIRAESRDNFWRFSVQDNGIGFASENCERIFILFQRLHSRQAYPGAGIGLAICKKIVERHGGHIWADSEPGLGATFRFDMPVASMNSDND